MKSPGNLLHRSRNATHVDPEELAEKTTETLYRLGDQASALAQSVVEQAAASAMSGAERVKEVGGTLGEAARDRSPQVSHVPHKVADEVVPAVRDVALQAASLALELWQAARDRAVGAGESARHDLAPQAAGVVGAAERRAGAATQAVALKSQEALSRTRNASRHAAQATVDTGKETGAMLFWAGAATGVVLFALLDKERREQLMRIAESSISQIRDVIQDFQGYDEEFKPGRRLISA